MSDKTPKLADISHREVANVERVLLQELSPLLSRLSLAEKDHEAMNYLREVAKTRDFAFVTSINGNGYDKERETHFAKNRYFKLLIEKIGSIPVDEPITDPSDAILQAKKEAEK